MNSPPFSTQNPIFDVAYQHSKAAALSLADYIEERLRTLAATIGVDPEDFARACNSNVCIASGDTIIRMGDSVLFRVSLVIKESK